ARRSRPSRRPRSSPPTTGRPHPIAIGGWRALPNISSAASTGCTRRASTASGRRSEEHTSELQSRFDLVCRLLLEKKKKKKEQNKQKKKKKIEKYKNTYDIIITVKINK